MEAHSFTRIVAYLIDIIIVSLFMTIITYWIPVSKEYEESVILGLHRPRDCSLWQ